MADPPVRPGDILARKYRVDRVLGAGAMGVVVAATHVELGQVVAVKHLLTGNVVSIEQRERFLREARAAVLLKSHHVARVLDVGTDENDAPYIVMEYLEGQDLSALLKNKNKLPVGEAVEYILQACEAIGEAHAAGTVHRDLKPANMFLTEDVSGAPIVKVLDFGISKLLGADVALTHESQMLGSPLYMSPEQMTAPTSVDARSDIWALGIILYQLVAGWPPFYADTIQGVCGLVIGSSPTPLATYRADISPAFESVILRCLERDREKRFRDVAEFALALLPFAPERARIYVERVKRVLVGRASRAGSSAELSPSSPTLAAPLATQPLPAMQATPPAQAAVSAPMQAQSASTSSSHVPLWKIALAFFGALLVGLGATIGLLMQQENQHKAAASSEPAAASASTPAPVASPVVTPAPAVSAEPPPTEPTTKTSAATTKPSSSKTPTKIPTKKNTSLYEP